MSIVRLVGRHLVISVLLGSVLLPLGATSVSAHTTSQQVAIVNFSIPPSPDVQKVREALLSEAQLSRFTVEIDGLTTNLPVASAFGAWYAAHPADVVAFLQVLDLNPAWRQTFLDWVASNPVAAAALFQALAAGPSLSGNVER